MGTCCAACLTTKIRDYASNAENGAVTVSIIENPNVPVLIKAGDELSAEMLRKQMLALIQYMSECIKCDLCPAPAEFKVSYHPKT